METRAGDGGLQPTPPLLSSHHSTQLYMLKLQYRWGSWGDAERAITPCNAISNHSWRLAAGGIYKKKCARQNQQPSWPCSQHALSTAPLSDENKRRAKPGEEGEGNAAKKKKGKKNHPPDRGSPGLSRLQHDSDGGVGLIQGWVRVVLRHWRRCSRTKSNALLRHQLLPLVVIATCY